MNDTNQVFEMLSRMIADETADLRERIQHLESKTSDFVMGDVPVDKKEIVYERNEAKEEADEFLSKECHDLTQRLAQIKALHALDATPLQWTRDNSGKMVEAPEGVWEISCLACNHQTTWREGNTKPPQCKTWLLADGSLSI